MSNKNKPTLGLGALFTPVEDPASFEAAVQQCIADKDAIVANSEKIVGTAKRDGNVEIEQEFVSIAGLASQGRDALVAKLREHMLAGAPKEYVPPALTERQLSQLEREMDAGRRASERAAAQNATRPQPKPEASDGYTVPAFRPGDHVPNFDSKDPGARTLK